MNVNQATILIIGILLMSNNGFQREGLDFGDYFFVMGDNPGFSDGYCSGVSGLVKEVVVSLQDLGTNINKED